MRLVANGYTHTYNLDLDNGDTFSPITKIYYCSTLHYHSCYLSSVPPLMDIKNFFLCYLEEEIHVEQPLESVAQGSVS